MNARTNAAQLFADAPVPFALTEAGEKAVTDTAPRTWSFIDRRTGETVQYTCMEGCTLDHRQEIGRSVFREDIWCWFWDAPLTLPVNASGELAEFRVLDAVIKVEPWSPKVAERLPYAVIELVDDRFIDGLDPDGLETVINALAARVERMRETHRRLVEVRKEYQQNAARAVRSQADEALRRVRGGAF
ncbi:DUF6907 domain-containing protein [Streptomyces sp. NPDC048362]|uniref:DUF6907 domain-containing protein n=1 Tax=Streptomyces sp. NPDC048362 TaxID=3365539 RepID=UPI0037236156